MKNLLATGVFLSIFFVCFSQTNPELPPQEWRITGGISNAKQFYGRSIDFAPLQSSAYDFNMSKIMLSANEAAALCSIEKDKYGVVMVNNKMQSKWLTPIEGLPCAITKFFDQILVISMRGKIDDPLSLDATLLDARNGKLISAKNIYNVKSQYKSEPKFFFDVASNSYKIGIRETSINLNDKRSTIAESRKLSGLTTGFTLLTLNDKADVVKNVKVPVSSYSYFSNCAISSRGDFYWVTSDEDLNYTVEKFTSPEQKAVSRMNINISAGKKSRPVAQFIISKYNPDIMYLAASFDNDNKDHVAGLYKLNFKDNKMLRDEVVYNKDYASKAKDNFQVINKDIDNPSTKYWDDMQVTEIIEEGNRVILYNEVGGSYSAHYIDYSSGVATNAIGAQRYDCRDGLINFYDNDLKLINTQIVPKFSEAFIPIGLGSSLHISGNKLFIVSNDFSGLMVFKALYGVFDLTTGKTLKLEHISKAVNAKSDPADPKATLWFEDGFITTYLGDERNYFKIKKLKAGLQKVSY